MAKPKGFALKSLVFQISLPRCALGMERYFDPNTSFLTGRILPARILVNAEPRLSCSRLPTGMSNGTDCLFLSVILRILC